MNYLCWDCAYPRALNENVTLAGPYSGWYLGLALCGESGTSKNKGIKLISHDVLLKHGICEPAA